jgi:hypothetical protein
MLPINNHDAYSITPIVLPPAHAAGAEKGATVQSHCTQNAFVDVTPCDDPETERCQALWRAVIGQQISDAKNTSHKPEKQLLKSQALDWLFHNECDFAMACDLAGWEPDYVYSLCVRAELHGFRRRIVRVRKDSRHE